MDLMKKHAPCLKGPLHVFVYSEPWPPFPDQATLASPFKVELAAEEPQIELGIEDLHIKLEALELESPHDIIQTISDPDKVPEVQDVKPQIIRKSRWVTIHEINRWSHCQRCGFEHSKSEGWLRHAQMCAQDPKYKTDMFFIYLHTKAWCGTLVQDAFWEKHTDREGRLRSLPQQPPRLKCIKCNIWREMDLMKEHAPCLKGPLHVFVYSEPWPPFPDQATLASPFKVELAAEEPQIELGIEDLHIKLEALELESPHDIIQTISDSDKVPEIQDVKPQIIRKSRWVTIREINRWSHCQRCGFEHSKSKGWLHHAQMCAQDPKYKTDMFFIYLHTKAWCGTLVQDAYWEKHTDPEKGDCAVCRSR
ncbi:GH15482 [Drosophila grimshawi]|uniref:GH15482 n=1 Tax=Drosophila grimshawi TaxID=7222 RepID=B4J2A5_DROGR|nr:GH15482 [Drosophila grimshawi]